MLMITEKFRKGIQSSLNSNYLNSDDFYLKANASFFGNPKIDAIVKITYRDIPEHYYEISIIGEEFSCKYQPGKILSTESRTTKNVELLNEYIGDWVNNIENEITSVSTNNNSSDETVINKIIDLTANVEDIPFSNKELVELHRTLDELKEKLDKKIEQDRDKEEKLNEEINMLKNEIEFLKKTSANLTKQKWVSSFIRRFYKWCQENPTLAKLIATAGFGLISSDLTGDIPKDYMNLLLPNIDTEGKDPEEIKD